eukprot:scaffold32972_cov135-Isochrysis_galbana.AAC.2
MPPRSPVDFAVRWGQAYSASRMRLRLATTCPSRPHVPVGSRERPVNQPRRRSRRSPTSPRAPHALCFVPIFISYTCEYNAVNYVLYETIAAVAIGAVLLGDKGAPENTAHFNSTHEVDAAEIGGEMMIAGGTASTRRNAPTL